MLESGQINVAGTSKNPLTVAEIVAAEPEASLRRQLESYVLESLVFWQQGDYRERARKVLVEVWDPNKSQSFIQGAQVCKRMEDYHFILLAARERGKVFPWIYTPAAAAAFEPIFEASVLVWLGVALPEDPKKIAEPVRAYVSWQTRLFAAGIGPLG